jgi:hypothetical protein
MAFEMAGRTVECRTNPNAGGPDAKGPSILIHDAILLLHFAKSLMHLVSPLPSPSVRTSRAGDGVLKNLEEFSDTAVSRLDDPP